MTQYSHLVLYSVLEKAALAQNQHPVFLFFRTLKMTLSRGAKSLPIGLHLYSASLELCVTNRAGV